MLVGLDGFPPLRNTNDTLIKVETLVIPPNSAVVLTLNDANEMVYTHRDKNTLTTTLCMKEKEFPKKAADFIKLQKIKQRMLDNLDNSKELMETYRSSIRKQLLTLPYLGNMTHMKRVLNQSIEVDTQSVISKIIRNQLNQLVLPISRILTSVRSYADMIDLTIMDNNFHDIIKALL